ncbi:UTP--glucose-1-phosphate uridylyltransferase [bacterium]|nr:UTP--glucose-1-phosphate uridylyltransferase [candidate division CSSED10-310 bacterium]
MIHHSKQQIRKAVIPIAGLGTRLFPATRAIPKAMLPVISGDGRVSPLVLILIEEALQSGVERVGLVINPGQRPVFEKFFHRDLPRTTRLKTYNDPYMSAHRNRMQHLCGRVELLTQPDPAGFGDAVFQARSWVGGEPFLLMLGDHLFRSNTDVPCCRQLIQAYYSRSADLVGVIRLPIREAPKRGTAALRPCPQSERRYEVLKIIEKPDIETARKEMRSEDQTEDIACFFGCYIFTSDIFLILEYFDSKDLKFRGEFQLTEAMEILRESKSIDGYEIDGDSLDIGNIDDYRQAFSFLVSR